MLFVRPNAGADSANSQCRWSGSTRPRISTVESKSKIAGHFRVSRARRQPGGISPRDGISKCLAGSAGIYPQGLPIPTDVDPKGLKPGWQRQPGEVDNRDLKFVDALLAKLREQYSIDDQHIFAAGFSNGAGFTYLLWLERPQTFAGFATAAGKSTLTGKLTAPKPAVQIGGQADKLVPPSDLKISMTNVRRLNGCSERGEPCGQSCARYASSKNAPVVQWIHSGPHIYPPHATELIVNFFKEVASGESAGQAAATAETPVATETETDEESFSAPRRKELKFAMPRTPSPTGQGPALPPRTFSLGAG